MKKLKITQLGDAAQGIVLRGNPKNPEPTHVRIVFPFGEVDVTRVDQTDGSPPEYWVHVAVAREDHAGWNPETDVEGKIVDARLDVTDKHSSETDPGSFADPNLYHLAVRVAHRSPVSAS